MANMKIMVSIGLFWALANFILPCSVLSQDNMVALYDHQKYEEGQRAFRMGAFGVAQHYLEDYLRSGSVAGVNDCARCKIMAKLMISEARFYQNDPDADRLMEETLAEIRPDPLADEALSHIADHHFKRGEYKAALKYYGEIELQSLGKEDQTGIIFNMGYSHFQLANYPEARSSFYQAMRPEYKYYYPATYYYGLSNYYSGDLEEAVGAFERLHNSEFYQNEVPYLISQIYYSQARYSSLVTYLSPQIENPELKNRQQLFRLLGGAYFHLGDHTNADQYLSIYEQEVKPIDPEVFYQIGESRFHNRDFERASLAFLEIRNKDGELGQLALYRLGTCYLKLEKWGEARIAFQQCASREGREEIREEALFQYGKLCVKEKFPEDAIRALRAISRSSKNYDEAQDLLSKILTDSRNYDEALEILEEIKGSSVRLREAYQRVCFLKGIERINAGDWTEGDKWLSASLDEPLVMSTKCQALYWKAEAAQHFNKTSLSNQYYQQFLTLAGSVEDLPKTSSVITARYGMGYNHLKLGQYGAAQEQFEKVIRSIKGRLLEIRSAYIKDQLLPDAIIRAADCRFKQNDYPGALTYYQEAIQKDYPGSVYALFQKAMIQGLTDKPYEKLVTLEKIIKEHPDHELADDAYYQAGTTYLQLSRFSEARDAFNAITQNYARTSPLVVSALIKTGLIYYNQGDVYRALDTYKKVFEHHPDQESRQETLLAVQEIYIQDLNQPDAYIAFLENIPGYRLDASGKDSISYAAASAPYFTAQYDKAIRTLSDYIRSYPNGAYRLDALFNRGDSRLFIQDYDGALEDFEILVEMGNNRYFEQAAKNAATIYFQRKDYDSSLKYYESYLLTASSDEHKLEALTGALKSSFLAGNSSRIDKYAHELLAHPRSGASEKALANYYLGKQFFDERDFSNAVKAFNEVTKLSDNEMTAEARYMIAYMYFLNQENGIAERLCKNAIRESGAYPYWVARCLLLNADIKLRIGDLFDARASIEALLESYQDRDDGILNEANEKLELIKQKENEQMRTKSDQ